MSTETVVSYEVCFSFGSITVTKDKIILGNEVSAVDSQRRSTQRYIFVHYYPD